MDTVFEGDNLDRRELFYDSRKDVLWHPNGAGFDDKAGIFSILKIIEDGFMPHVIFTTCEEIGSRGAERLANEIPDVPFEDLKYLIELDRANDNDCVFYNCWNYMFEDYVASFGFERKWGTSSDICKICPKWEIAGVNLSIGYEDQHTEFETLDVDAMLSTILRVKEMLVDAKNIDEPFEYELVMSDY
jgi:putative aminopeptidase FrvX